MRRNRKPIGERDKKILLMMSLGMTQQEMADDLFLNKFVIHRRCTLLYERLGASNAPSAVAIAIATGLIPNPYGSDGLPVLDQLLEAS